MAGSHTSLSEHRTSTDPSPLTLVSSVTTGLAGRLAGRVDEHLARFAAHMREGLLAASTAVGLELMAELMAAEVTDLAGPKGRHDPNRAATRHGGEAGTVTLGGRRLPVRRPRVGSVGADAHELTLESYETFASTDLLTDGVVARMLAGLSTRRYDAGLEPVGVAVGEAATGTSKSAVSRRFVTATAERVAQLCARPLGGDRWLVVFVDGFHFAGHCLVGALGVTAEGATVPLGVVEGSTENAAVCTRLVADLAERGLDAAAGVLFVVDGGKAIDKVVRAVFGDKALIQRCRRHYAEERVMPSWSQEALWDRGFVLTKSA
ncbi:MAG: transposase [Acidimicrobiia bacterium]